MSIPPIYSSLTRISQLPDLAHTVEQLPRSEWASGDYVAVNVQDPITGFSKIELSTGRMREVVAGDVIVGALGERSATLEATGTWRDVDDDGRMQALTGAGLFGKVTSKSMSIPALLDVRYRGHICVDGQKHTMHDCRTTAKDQSYTLPTVLVVGTSMAAGKTTSARVIIRMLRRAGMRVVGAKLTGAGRLRDILSMADAGAHDVFDFVDVGLPSTVYPENAYMRRLKGLLSLMVETAPDVAVVEIGASPLEPYNGEAAIEKIRPHVRCTVLSASDPYAVHGVMSAFDMVPDIVGGLATSTDAGVDLVRSLTGVPAVNWLDTRSYPTIRRVLEESLDVDLGS